MKKIKKKAKKGAAYGKRNESVCEIHSPADSGCTEKDGCEGKNESCTYGATQPATIGRDSMVEEAEWLLRNRHPLRASLPQQRGWEIEETSDDSPQDENKRAGWWQRLCHRIRRKQDP